MDTKITYEFLRGGNWYRAEATEYGDPDRPRVTVDEITVQVHRVDRPAMPSRRIVFCGGVPATTVQRELLLLAQIAWVEQRMARTIAMLGYLRETLASVSSTGPIGDPGYGDLQQVVDEDA